VSFGDAQNPTTTAPIDRSCAAAHEAAGS
jgi:hypothetical protein